MFHMTNKRKKIHESHQTIEIIITQYLSHSLAIGPYVTEYVLQYMWILYTGLPNQNYEEKTIFFYFHHSFQCVNTVRTID